MQGLLLALITNVALAAQTGVVAGTVVDPSGAAVEAATVRLETSGVTIDEFRTVADGHFEFRVQTPTPLRLVVTAAGFAEVVLPVPGDARNLTVTLQPAPFFEAVNVTSSRTDAPRADPTVAVTVIPAAELLTSGALTLDDALKMVPGFTLFRRTSSRVSNPTAQGVTLRGLGGTGASRSLVLADGLPLNDAFGGWVYWDKLPQAAVDRIEVLRGSGSDLYGADAVGGVVQILTWQPTGLAMRAIFEGGSDATGRVSLFGGGRADAWSFTAGGEWFNTDGYIAVAEQQDPGIAPRGPIDTPLASTHDSGLASVAYAPSNGWRFSAAGNVFSENRENGTPAVTNDTASRHGTAEVTGGLAGGLVSARAYYGTQGYDQTFSAVSADRTSEDLNRLQRVPTRVTGTGAQWMRSIGRHTLLMGADARFIKGETQEVQLSAGRVVATLNNGGTQHVVSTYVQDTFAVNERLTLVAGAHGDGWHTDSKNTSYTKTLGSLNPRASAAYRMTDDFSLRASVYKGFRAPTLNELYRGFRAGNTQTNPNEALAPERLNGFDAGLVAAHGPWSARVTGFWNVLHDVITNVTVSSTPQLITKIRANADKMRTTGVEIEGDLRPAAWWSVGFAGAIVNAVFQGDTSLRGNRVPQVPQYNAGLNLRFNRDNWIASSQLRVTGLQFEDDLNAFRLRPATVLDALVSRNVLGKARVFMAIENVFDNEYDVGRTPILTTGVPRVARIGMQLSLP